MLIGSPLKFTWHFFDQFFTIWKIRNCLILFFNNKKLLFIKDCVYIFNKLMKECPIWTKHRKIRNIITEINLIVWNWEERTDNNDENGIVKIN